MSHNLALPFFHQAGRSPDRPALSLNASETTYGELQELSGRIAAWLTGALERPPARVAILAAQSLEAYAGILGACWAGAAYVPLSPKAPEERLIRVLEIVGPDAVILDEGAIPLLSPRLLDRCPARLLAPGGSGARELDAESAGKVVVEGRDSMPARGQAPSVESVSEDRLAYVMFTSGTTGVPKGVMVSAGNVAALLSALRGLYVFTPEDRVSQTFDLTFDLSVFDMFMTWGAGACLCVVPASQRMGPSRFIREERLTVWFSVPSTVAFMRSMKMLAPGAFPTLRHSLFCGEPLPLASVEAWREAAPGSVIDSLYGPTEATVACLAQRVTNPPPLTRDRGIVPLGKPFPGMEAAVLDSERCFLAADREGELALAGPQLAKGYFADPEQTAARFPTISGKTWYLTGDVAYRDAEGVFHYLGRSDHQVKILGNRVELGEVDAHLREVCGSDLVAAVAWPIEEMSARGIVAFVVGAARSAADIRSDMGLRVPTYMVPSRIEFLETLPLSSSGKVDRKQLFQRLERERLRQRG